MKRLSGLFVMMFLLVGTLGFVVAAEDDDEVREAKKVGFFENLGDRIGLAFTFDKERKIEKVLEMAEKRLAEAELLAEENPEAYERAQVRYDELVARAEEILANIESRAEDVNGSVDEMGQIARIQDKFERHRAHADEIYARVLERFELNNASDEKIERFEMFYERALNRSDRMEVKIIEKRERAIEKHKDLSNVSDDEISELLLEIEDREGLSEFREERKLRAEVRIERVVELKGRYIEKLSFRLESSNLNEEQRVKIEIRLEAAEGKIERFEFRARERIESEDGRFELRIRERLEDGVIRSDVRIRERYVDDSVEDALRAEEEGLKRAEEELKEILEAQDKAFQAALKAEEDALRAAEDSSSDESQ